MMRRPAPPLLLIGAMLLPGCTGLLLPDEPPPTPEAVFMAFWSEFDEYYAYFGEKGVDWDSVYAVHRPRIRENTGDSELFGILIDMVAGFEDGHITLYSPFAQWSYEGWHERSPLNYEPDAVRRLLQGDGSPLPAGGMRVGRLPDGVGYLRIENFVGGGFAESIDRALEALDGARALVIDIRSNGGGSDLNSGVVLGRFADRERVYAYVRYRNGPAHDDFTVPRAKTVKPIGKLRFTGPVAVLTNRGTFSTAESFVLGMAVLPNVVVVGDTTGGGFGNPYWRELPNGWSFRLSRWRMESASGATWEGIGIAPDVPVWITDTDQQGGVDTILGAAVADLLERLPGS